MVERGFLNRQGSRLRRHVPEGCLPLVEAMYASDLPPTTTMPRAPRTAPDRDAQRRRIVDSPGCAKDQRVTLSHHEVVEERHALAQRVPFAPAAA